jgi:hypothetical protein
MKRHANAALGLNQRRRMVRRVVEERTCSKWVRRYLAEGETGLLDRSSAPKSIPHRTRRTGSRRSPCCAGCD